MTFHNPLTPEAIPLSVPLIRGNEWAYVKECLDTGWVSSVGGYVDRFEQTLASRIGARYAVATSSGTAALHLALIVAGIQPDEEVLVSTLSFIAPANAVRYVGAWPVFIDAEPLHGQMDPNQAADFLDRGCTWKNDRLVNKKTGRRVTAILPVHILGHPVDMDPLLEAARKYGLTVIEDAAESIGARYKERAVGVLGDVACFSFNGNKIITTGGGGMLLTNRGDWAEKARYLSTQAKDDLVEYVHREMGYNYRLTNVQAAIGCAQLEQLGSYIELKRRIAARYRKVVEHIPGMRMLEEARWAFSICWLPTIIVDEKSYGKDSRKLMTFLAQRGIQSRPLWEPLHASKVHRSGSTAHCPVATQLHRDALTLPASPSLRDAEQDRVCEALAHIPAA